MPPASKALESLGSAHGGGLASAGRVVASTTAVFFLGAAAIHVSAAADHKNLPVMLAGFLCVAAAQAAFAALFLTRRPSRLAVVAGLVLMVGALGAWLVSRTAGLPFLAGGHMEPIGFKDGVTVLFELASLAGLLMLASEELAKLTLPSPRLGQSAVAGASAAAFLLFVPALVLGGGGHHSAAQMAASAGHAHAERDGHRGAAAGAKLASLAPHAHGRREAAVGGARHRQGHRGHAASLAPFTDDGPGGGSAGSGSVHGHALAKSPGAGGGSGDSGGDHRSHGGGDERDQGADQRDDGSRHEAGGHPPREERPVPGHRRPDPHGGSHSGDHGDADGGHAAEAGGGIPGPDDPASGQWGAHRIDYEPARPGQSGEPGRGYAVVYRGPPDPKQGGVGHHSSEPCRPSAEQEAAADRLHRATDTVIRRYDNRPDRALADGFTYIFPVTDRIIHMVSPSRVFSPTILTAKEIESFLYVMTHRGLTAVAGMYVMPDADVPGPQVGGCLTRWHRHSGVAGLAVSAGTMNRTPEMLHVWTYPGLKPYGHYDGRTLSQLWRPGSMIPSACRESGDSSDACLP